MGPPRPPAAAAAANPPAAFAWQDTTTNPLWTGEKPGLSLEDERLRRVVGRFSEFMGDEPPPAKG